MFINGPFPDFKSEISEEYKIVSADRNSFKKQRRYVSRIMLFYSLSIMLWTWL